MGEFHPPWIVWREERNFMRGAVMSKNGYSDEQAEDIEKRWFIATGCTFGDDEAGEYLAAILRLAYLAQGVGDTSREEILMEWAWDDLLAAEKEAERGRG